MKNHFIISYFGNKREEVENLYKLMKLDDIEIIIEPFCGSCALSYYISLLHPKKYKYILNDNNKYLIELMNIMKDDNKINEFENKINDYVEQLNNIKIQEKRKELYLKFVKTDDIYGYLISHKYYTIRHGLFKFDKDKNGDLLDYKKFYFKDYPIYNFFKNEDIEIYNLNGIKIFEKYKQNKKALIFLDPPYIQLTNAFYKNGANEDFNIYEYLSLNNIKKEKAKIYIILEDNWIIKLLFKNNNIIDNNCKIYQTTKKKYNHITITNLI